MLAMSPIPAKGGKFFRGLMGRWRTRADAGRSQALARSRRDVASATGGVASRWRESRIATFPTLTVVPVVTVVAIVMAVAVVGIVTARLVPSKGPRFDG